MLVFATPLATLSSTVRSRAALELENLALRHQTGVLLAWLSHIWSDRRSPLAIVQPETVMAWHRKGFHLFWAWKIRRGRPGRPTLATKSTT